jgi:cadmium resistance transport/sequestration family protein
MNPLLSAAAQASVAFAMTNLDDIVILMLFFAQVNTTFRKRHIVAGQYLGFAALVGISLLGFVGALIIPRQWIGLLGIVPVAMGIRKLLRKAAHGDAPSVPSAGAISVWSVQTYGVAAVTLANGGDNIGIYVPLFAGRSIGSLAVVIAVFFVLVGVWCYVGYRLVRYPAVGRVLARYGERIAPFVLIALGVYILLESGALGLVFQ